MTFTIIAGGFWGDEGKGKICTYLALHDNPKIVARAGTGPNAGHTIWFKGKEYKLRMVPSGFVNPKPKLMIGPGVLLNPNVLLDEIGKTGCENRITVDRQCGIIEEKHIEIDTQNKHLTEKVGTTGSGCGPANADRAMRTLKLAKDVPALEKYLTDVSLEVNKTIDQGKTVIAEGSQAAFLSLYHGDYPFVTSHDTTAAGICSDLGVGPTKVNEVLVLMKAYITRVGEGQLPGELSVEEVKKRGWDEYGAVTGRPRRAAPFNFNLAKKAIRLNGGTQIALTKMDIVFPELKQANKIDKLKGEAENFVDKVEHETKTKVALLGTGPSAEDVIDLRENM